MDTMPKSIVDLQKDMLALNSADKPYLIKVEGNQIVGTWNIVDADWIGIASANHLDKDYTITVDLDETKHEYDYSDVLKSTSGGLSGGGLSFGKTYEKGKIWDYEGTIDFGVGVNKAKNPEKIVAPIVYTFNNSDIKKPILETLRQAGWKQKKGFWGKLFG
jgi:hypothetical protein